MFSTKIKRATLFAQTGWFILTSGLIAMCGALLIFHSTGLPNDPFALFFLALALPGHFIFLAAIAALPTLVIIAVYPNRHLVSAVLLSCGSALFILIAVDIKVFELYRFHLNRMVYELLVGGAADDIFAFSGIDIALFAGAVLTLFGVAHLCLKLARRFSVGRLHGSTVTLIVVLIMVAGQITHAIADAMNYRPVLTQVAMIPWAKPMTAKRSLRRLGIQLPASTETAKGLEEIRTNARLNYPTAQLSCRPPEEKQNLLVILVDGLRFDMFNPEVMPNAQLLLDSAWEFTSHFSTSNATRFGVFGLFYGLNANYWHNFLAAQRAPVLIEQLQLAGYQHAVHASAKLTSPEFDRTVFAGIRDEIRLATPGGSKHARDQQITKDFIDFLNQDRDEQSPFFGLLFYDAPHGFDYPADFKAPFQPALDKVSYLKLGADSDPEPFRNRYRNSIAFVDAELRKVFEVLRETDLWENTTIVLSADHGQEFNETGLNYWGHNGNFSRWQTQVPLIIRTPGRPARTFTHPTSHTDVVPTLMRDLLGCENSPNQFSNGDYLDEVKEQRVLEFTSWSRYALWNGKQISVIQNSGLTEHFDLSYRPLDSATIDPAAVKEILQQRSVFIR